ncbi:hypothetical protein PHYSODRAFT_342522 [Phytophthora sojae]|uniref:Uncharacterized protein n=1 Tax=Phytophthora sojae (strain P6497) TaxID=1094619 RepID=G5AGV0_PHYSP|nr:hypothetical protein PHYSODRAFT_342522 [Phytophthora sojae]EGZ05143.1 hypothetical protein PHYSODRAFT_342522 [Phytophthora sojae]|eukprot:XP_009539301.1 hypothetical protein PHYSODRAFT_342522 [Phytophthora sojae]
MSVLLQLLLLPLLATASPAIDLSPPGNDVCLDESSIRSVAANLNANAPATGSDVSEKKDLPVFFFHGLTGNSGEVPMVIAAVHEVVASDQRFADIYIFIGRSQGAMIARAVIEQMDDHKVHTYVSLAGGVNGIFYGPQEADRNSIHDLGAGFGAAVLPQNLFDFTGYTPEGYRGKMQADFARRCMDPKLQATYSYTNLGRIPVRDVWLATNEFLPMINNVNICAWFDFHCHLEKIRRKNNFLRLKEAHFFASPDDGAASPWQMGLLEHYSEVETLEELETRFESLTIVEMRDTVEYKDDTYGLRTLDERGALFRYPVPGVPHCCWLYDTPKFHEEGLCKFHPVFDEYVYKVLR